MFDPLLDNVIYLIIIVGAVTIIGKTIVLPMIQWKIKEKNIAIKKQKEGKTMEESLDDLINNAPELYGQVTHIIEEQRAKGVPDEKMSGLISKQGLLKTIVDNQELVSIFGKPAVKFIVSITKRIGLS